MLLLAAGLGGASRALMTAVPPFRRIILVMALTMAVVMAYQMRNAKRSKSVRLMNVASVIVTLGLVAWSVMQFGL